MIVKALAKSAWLVKQKAQRNNAVSQLLTCCHDMTPLTCVLSQTAEGKTHVVQASTGWLQIL